MIYMDNTKIEKFEFSKAGYVVGNGKSEVSLQIDYKNKKFKVAILRGRNDKEFVSEVERIAAGLISRKHGENFAWKFQNGKIDNDK